MLHNGMVEHLLDFEGSVLMIGADFINGMNARQLFNEELVTDTCQITQIGRTKITEDGYLYLYQWYDYVEEEVYYYVVGGQVLYENSKLKKSITYKPLAGVHDGRKAVMQFNAMALDFYN